MEEKEDDESKKASKDVDLATKQVSVLDRTITQEASKGMEVEGRVHSK